MGEGLNGCVGGWELVLTVSPVLAPTLTLNPIPILFMFLYHSLGYWLCILCMCPKHCCLRQGLPAPVCLGPYPYITHCCTVTVVLWVSVVLERVNTLLVLIVLGRSNTKHSDYITEVSQFFFSKILVNNHPGGVLVARFKKLLLGAQFRTF